MLAKENNYAKLRVDQTCDVRSKKGNLVATIKDNIHLKTSRVYKVRPSCGMSNIGQTKIGGNVYLGTRLAY